MNMSLSVSYIAGNGQRGYKDGKAEDAIFDRPDDLCISNEGKIYISDSCNHCIRMINNGVVSTIAGCSKQGFRNGKAENASFYFPSGICISDDGNIYVADTGNHCIRIISGGMVSTFAGTGEGGFEDGEAQIAMFNNPSGICISKDNVIYVVDFSNNAIRKVSDGMVSTVAGCGIFGFEDGKTDDALLKGPYGVCISDDDKIYISDGGNYRIRMVSNGLVSTIAGCGQRGLKDGKAQDAKFYDPRGICMYDENIYVVDSNNCIRLIADGLVSTIAGCIRRGFADGEARLAMFDQPNGICISDFGQMYLTDRENNRIRMISGLPIPSTAFKYFELSLLLNSKSLSDMTLTINNHQYHLHTDVLQSLSPLIIKYKSTIEEAKISHESLQTMFEMIYSNNTNKIRKSKPNQYEMKDLTHLVELIWLFESFEINNRSFVKTCTKQFELELEYFGTLDGNKSDLQELKTDLIHRIDEFVALSNLHGLQTRKLVQINHFINQNNEQNDNKESQSNNTINNNLLETLIISIHDIFMLLGLHTEPRVVDQPSIKSETVLQCVETPNTELKTLPDYTIMTHDKSYSTKCHKLILYAKWSYFRRMIESGLLESASGEMIMSEDWNATRLFDFIKYLYTHEVGFESAEDALWLLNNAELYELMEIFIDEYDEESMIAKSDFRLLFAICTKRVLENY